MVRSGLDRRRLRGIDFDPVHGRSDHANRQKAPAGRDRCAGGLGMARGSRGRPQRVSRIDSAIPSAPKIQIISGLPQGRRRPFTGTLRFSSGNPLRRSKAERRESMMHPHWPGPLPVAVPDIGFPQNISIGPKWLDSSASADLSGERCGVATRQLDRIVWLPSLRPWFGLHS